MLTESSMSLLKLKTKRAEFNLIFLCRLTGYVNAFESTAFITLNISNFERQSGSEQTPIIIDKHLKITMMLKAAIA